MGTGDATYGVVQRGMEMKRPAMNLAVVAVIWVIGTGLAVWPSLAQATLIGYCDTDSPGQCTGTVTLEGGILTLALTNTSPTTNAGFITAIAFNLAGDTTITAFESTESAFGLAPGFDSTGGSFNVSPDGTREFVISTQPGATNPYQGSGTPTTGIAPGETVTFQLTLGGTGSGEVTDANFISSELVRFRGFTDGTSDKDHDPVPEPATLLLLGSGVLGAAVFSQRIRKRD